MPIQLIIFLTKNKIFACEINNNGQADAISINGNPEIKCEGKESVDEMMDCLFDAFSIDGFGDEHFDIVIVDCGGDKNVIAYASEKCMGADKLSIISVEKLLPLIVWNKTQLQAGEEVVVAFDEASYKVVCDEKNVVKYIGKARKGKENIALDTSDFGCLYYFDVGKMKGGVVDTKALQEKDAEIEKLEEEKDNLAETLNEKENSLAILQKEVQDAKNNLNALMEEKAQWEKEHPKPSNLVEQMVKIVEECRNEVVDYADGYFYIKGKIPKQYLNLVIEEFTKKFGMKIERKNIVALYINVEDSRPSYNALQKLLICQEFLCIDNFSIECGNKEEISKKPIYWKDLVNIKESRYDYQDNMDFRFYNGTVVRTTMAKHFSVENTLFKKLVPTLNELNKLINMEEVE